MTEEKKQELRRLLEEAMDSLEVLRSGGKPSLVPVEVYRKHLQKRWTSYTENVQSALVSFTPNIEREATKANLLDFIRMEFAHFIHEDKIQSASFFIKGGPVDGFPLNWLLEQLLRITIARGIDEAVSTFDRCTEENSGSFQHFALLEGIRLKAELPVYKGIRLVPLSDAASYLQRYLPSYFIGTVSMPEDILHSKTMLVIDCSVSPIFHKPLPKLSQEDNYPFRVQVDGKDCPNFMADDFCEQFCQTLSLACNFPLQTAFSWRFLEEDRLFNLNSEIESVVLSISDLPSWPSNPLGISADVGKDQVDEAKSWCDILDRNPDLRETLRVPINRWIKSKVGMNPVENMIDLGIALEALYVPDSGEGEITFKLAVRAAWFLGKDKADREKLLLKFKAIYKQRSNLVHGGELKASVKIGGEGISTTKFIETARDLCRRSILEAMNRPRITEKGYWDSLILGGKP